MESRTLEEVVSNKEHPQRGLAMPMDEAMQYKIANGSPLATPAVGPVGPVADLLAKLQSTTKTEASSDLEEEAVKKAKVVHGDVAQAGNSTGEVEKVEVQAANSSKEEDKLEASNVTETSDTTEEVAQVVEAEVAEPSPSPLPAKSEETKNDEASQDRVTEASSHPEVEEAKQEMDGNAEESQVPAVVKLFGDADMSKRQVGGPQTFRTFVSFAVAAALSAFALLLGSRRSRPAQGSHVLLDLERDVE